MEWFVELTTRIELLLGIVSFSPVVKYVTYLFAAMAVGILFFFLFTLLALITNQITSHFYKIHHKRYTLWIIHYLIDQDFPSPYPDLLFSRAFEEALLDLLLITKGSEKNTLFKIYKKTGLWDQDLSKLRNPFWYVRLEALVSLDLWQFSLGSERILHLLDDENIQIRQITLKNLSRTKDPHEAEVVIKALNRGYYFYSVQCETIFRLVRVHRELVLKCLSDQEFKKIHPVIIKVIGDSRIIEGVPELIKAGSSSTEPFERELALISLGKIGDPRGLEILKKGLRSPFPRERLASLQSIHLIDPEEIRNHSLFLKADPDATVRSWYDHYDRGGQ